jgi:cell wall-associated NlpC family hydrolase
VPAPAAEPPAPAPEGILAYPGDQATPQQLAAWMGATAQQAGLPPQLPVMAALTESGLHNLSYGDRDSVGFFQMRLGIWNGGAYAGYPSNPQLQIKWFIDHALQARQQNPALGQSPSTWGEWIANVEQPAAEYRNRYQLQLGTAQELLHGASLTPAGEPAASAVDAAPAPAAVHHAPPPPPGPAAVEAAMRHLGAPFKAGGANPETGFDGPGLVSYAYGQEGIQLPHVAAEQFDVGIPVSKAALRPGDAVFFAGPNGYVRDVGLYIGNGRFVHAPEPGAQARISSLSDPPFAGEYAGARRYTAAALGDPTKYARSLPTIKAGDHS